jgi:hypothetical protein
MSSQAPIFCRSHGLQGHIQFPPSLSGLFLLSDDLLTSPLAVLQTTCLPWGTCFLPFPGPYLLPLPFPFLDPASFYILCKSFLAFITGCSFVFPFIKNLSIETIFLNPKLGHVDVVLCCWQMWKTILEKLLGYSKIGLQQMFQWYMGPQSKLFEIVTVLGI